MRNSRILAALVALTAAAALIMLLRAADAPITDDAPPPPVAQTPAPEAPPEDGSRAFIQLWTLDDLAPYLANAEGPRNFETGRALFTEAGCNKCHVIRGEGIPIGPELSTISEKYQGLELLRQILEPSAIIAPEYTPYLIEKTNFSFLTGFIVGETEDTILFKSTSVFMEAPMVIPRSEIDSIKAAPLSAMPTGVLSTYSPEEILELLAYVESGGDPEGAVYQEAASEDAPLQHPKG